MVGAEGKGQEAVNGSLSMLSAGIAAFIFCLFSYS